MCRDPEYQRHLDALKADGDRIITVARVLAGNDPDLNALIDEAVAGVEASRTANP